MNENEIMTIEEVARLLRVSERTVYDWAQKGTIPAGKLGASWRFKRSQVEKWVDDRLSGSTRELPACPGELASSLEPNRVALLDCTTKEEALRAMISLLASSPKIRKVEELSEGIFHREQLMSTGIGYGVGIPHVRLGSITGLVMALGVNSRDILDYTSLDSTPVRIICMIASGEHQHSGYLQNLAAIGTRLKQPGIREMLLRARTPKEAYQVMTGAKAEK